MSLLLRSQNFIPLFSAPQNLEVEAEPRYGSTKMIKMCKRLKGIQQIRPYYWVEYLICDALQMNKLIEGDRSDSKVLIGTDLVLSFAHLLLLDTFSISILIDR